jgi:hypothetical protein
MVERDIAVSPSHVSMPAGIPASELSCTLGLNAGGPLQCRFQQLSAFPAVCRSVFSAANQRLLGVFAIVVPLDL